MGCVVLLVMGFPYHCSPDFQKRDSQPHFCLGFGVLGAVPAIPNGFMFWRWAEASKSSDVCGYFALRVLCLQRIYLSIYLPIYLSIHLSIYLYLYLYLYLSISIYLYQSLSISISIYLYLSLSISIYLYLSLSISIYLYLSLSISIYLYLSIYLEMFWQFERMLETGGTNLWLSECVAQFLVQGS